MTVWQTFAVVGIVAVLGLLGRLYWLVREEDLLEGEHEERRRRKALGHVTELDAWRQIERSGIRRNARRG